MHFKRDMQKALGLHCIVDYAAQKRQLNFYRPTTTQLLAVKDHSSTSLS
jgi:hypothetical protein